MRISEIEGPGVYPGIVSQGGVKFWRDVLSVLEMKLLFLVRGWQWYIIRPLVFPLGILFFLRVMVPDDPNINRTDQNNHVVVPLVRQAGADGFASVQHVLIGKRAIGFAGGRYHHQSYIRVQDRFPGVQESLEPALCVLEEVLNTRLMHWRSANVYDVRRPGVRVHTNNFMAPGGETGSQRVT